MIYILICFSLIGIFKATSDIVAHKDLWDLSIFSKYKEDSFLGHKDITWIRKYKYSNKILLWLFKNPLVMFTDLWHLSNSLQMLFFLVGINLGIFLDLTRTEKYILLIFCLPIYLLSFNIFYSFFLRKK